MTDRWIRAIRDRPAAAWGAALAGIVLIGAIDYASGIEVRTFPLYYGPISLLAWYRGRTAAMTAATLCAAAWLASNLLAGLQYSTTSIWVVNTVVQGTSFATVGLLIGVLRDRIHRERILNRVDPLTQLLNTRAFYEDAHRLVSLCRRKAYPLTMAYLDLDHFKDANDRFGHRAGDELLRAVGRLLSTSVRPSDLCARLGGDEFALLLPDTDSRDAAAMLERLRALLASSLASGETPVTASIGAVTFLAAPADVEQIVHDADAAMYAAKESGGNRVHLTVIAASRMVGGATS